MGYRTIICVCGAMLFPRILLVRPAFSWHIASQTVRRSDVRHSWSIRLQHHQSCSPSVVHWRLFSSKVGSATNESDIDSGSDELVINSSMEDSAILIPGIPSDFYIVTQYKTPPQFEIDHFDPEEQERLNLSPGNVSLPVALMIADPHEYSSFSQARKVCRKGNVIVHRGPLPDESCFALEKSFIGRVGDRIFPGDVIAKQVRMGTGSYPVMNYKQPFDLPVVYEDDYFAIVNKPAGVVVYAFKQENHGTMTIRCCLPFVLKPPTLGTYSVLRRPQPVHRLDKPTSGLLMVAKTKPSMQNLCQQFSDRTIKKAYTAIVNGIPFESRQGAISSSTAYDMGVDVDSKSDDMWQHIDFTLDEKEAITFWRSKRFTKCLKAQDQTLTTVELKPKTGRYHQLRRHMSWVCNTPLVGDDQYDGGGDAMSLRGRGLFLCSNRVTLEHPYFNTEQGRAIWDSMTDEERFGSGMVFCDDDDKIMVTASIDLPNKFESFLMHEEQRAHKFGCP